VDLEARARSDRKRVPILVTTVLTFLDNHYPDLEGDEARRGIWLVDVPLAQTHNLRASINTGKNFPHEVLEKYDIPIIANVLKLYLLELPGMLMPCSISQAHTDIHRFARFFARLRNCQDDLQHHGCRDIGRNPHLGDSVYPRPASTCQHCNTGCHLHALYASHRVNICR